MQECKLDPLKGLEKEIFVFAEAERDSGACKEDVPRTRITFQPRTKCGALKPIYVFVVTSKQSVLNGIDPTKELTHSELQKLMSDAENN